MTFSRRAFLGSAAVGGLTILGTAAGAPAAHALLPRDPGHEHHKGKGRGKGRGVNLLRNPAFELDAAGTTISNWTVA